jgi:hypothetical protein
MRGEQNAKIAQMLTEAIRATTAARNAIYDAATAYDEEAIDLLRVDHEVGSTAYRLGTRYGELTTYAAQLDAILTELRARRKAARG